MMTINDSSSLIPHSQAVIPSFTESFLSLFYIIRPSETAFKDISHVPDYTAAAVPSFFMLIALEFAIATLKGKRTLRVSDGVSSINAGVTSRLIKLVSDKSIELTMYIYVYENWRVLDLRWDSSWTWFISFLAMDFAYYWFHRAAHEVNIFWASHQTHHSSEDYNLTTALRQSSLQGFVSMFFYLPCAVAIPPSIHLVHLQVNILFQFWIHTELISSLGPLEYILNTPSHHRVHHGRNPYCIDKNYAGALIIWDRMFGTFAAEREEEKVAYGLVHPLNSFNPVYIQLGSLLNICIRCWKIDGLWNKFCVLMKGPGWATGKPRCGDFNDLPKVENPVVRYDRNISHWTSAYGFVHSIVMIPLFDKLMLHRLIMPERFIIIDVMLFLFTLTCMGYLFDRKSYAYCVECCRCFLFGSLLHLYNGRFGKIHDFPSSSLYMMESLYIASAFFCIAALYVRDKNKKKID